ncbi:unnamed protein product [Lampetra fluviatilis]
MEPQQQRQQQQQQQQHPPTDAAVSCTQAMDDDGVGDFTVVESRKRKARRDAAARGGGGTQPKRTVAAATAATEGESSSSNGSSDELNGRHHAVAERGDESEPQVAAMEDNNKADLPGDNGCKERPLNLDPVFPPPSEGERGGPEANVVLVEHTELRDVTLPAPDGVLVEGAMKGSQIGLGSAWERPASTETHAAIEEDSDDAESESDADEAASKRSYSSVAKEREYAPEEILLYLRRNYKKRGTKPEVTFPDLQGFLKTSRKIQNTPKSYDFTKQEIYRLRKLGQTLKKEHLFLQERPSHNVDITIDT